jgi:hypothetical protein
VTTHVADLSLVEIECSTPKQENARRANANLDTLTAVAQKSNNSNRLFFPDVALALIIGFEKPGDGRAFGT